MDKRYQVFVSSTYVDLIPERSEVQALLELKCMPAGMELFPAANETQWNWIKKVIDESDYYVVIVAGRYGTVSKDTGQSYTEMEYRYALGKPVIGFLHEDVSKLQARFVEQSTASRRKLDAFRQLVASKLCKSYNSPSDLGAKVSRSLTQLKEQHPATGWIRADALPTSATLDEILKLKDENERLKERVYRMGLQKPDSAEHLASGAELFELDFSFDRYARNPETEKFNRVATAFDKLLLSWDEIFSFAATDMIERRHSWSITQTFEPIVRQRADAELQRKYPDERFRRFEPSRASTDTILMQLRALKLITVGDNGYWELTPYGDNYLAKLLAVPKGKTRKESA